MRIQSKDASFDIYKCQDGRFGIYDTDGEVLYFDEHQAAQLIIVLQNALKTGEIPE